MGIVVRQISTKHYNANMFLMEDTLRSLECCLIDIGDAQSLFDVLRPEQQVRVLFLTHAHIDHIAGLKDLIARFPDCKIYASAYTKAALADSKLNLSFYHQKPIEFQMDPQGIVQHNAKILALPNGLVEVLETPGHNAGALSFKIAGGIFTGDSFIPGFKVVTKLKSGNQLQALKSIAMIMDAIGPEDWIYPGHGAPCLKYKRTQTESLLC